jgi:hypothetical protein
MQGPCLEANFYSGFLRWIESDDGHAAPAGVFDELWLEFLFRLGLLALPAVSRVEALTAARNAVEVQATAGRSWQKWQSPAPSISLTAVCRRSWRHSTALFSGVSSGISLKASTVPNRAR